MLAKKGQSGRFEPGGLTQPSKQKVKLEPETVFYEGRPSWTEVILPAVSIITVIGLIPFVAAVARQAWVKYKITSRRIAVDSGFQGKDRVEVVYRDIESVKYVRRMAGASADMVIALKDGAKLELRAVQEYRKIFDYIMSKVPDDVRVASGAP